MVAGEASGDLLASLLVGGMQAQGWGRIVNVTSAVDIQAISGLSAYTSAKGALIAVRRPWRRPYSTAERPRSAAPDGPDGHRRGLR